MLATAARKVGSLVETGEMVREFEDLVSTPSTYSRQIDIKAVLSSLCDEISAEYPDATLAVDGAAVELDVNPDLFEAVTYQLLENAVVHTDETPAAVTVDVTPTPSDVRLEVADSGPGIPDHELRALDHGQEDSLDHGSGFGLWLVKWGTLRMGGDVDFEATDSGTTVRLTLPRQADD
jgi:signal transduction histidine kinase